MALSLCRVLEVALYFSKDFLEAAVGESVVVRALWLLGVVKIVDNGLSFIFPLNIFILFYFFFFIIFYI